MLGTRPGAWPSLLASLVVLGVIVFRARAAQTRASQDEVDRVPRFLERHALAGGRIRAVEESSDLRRVR